MIESHSLETHCKRRREFGGKQSRISVKRSSLLMMNRVDGDGGGGSGETAE